MHIDDLSDDEIVDLIVEHLAEDDRVKTEFIVVEVNQGHPIIRGRVGSDEEVQVIDEILNDVLDIHDFENNVWVDDSLAFVHVDDEGEEVAEVTEESEDDEEEEDPPFDDDKEK